MSTTDKTEILILPFMLLRVLEGHAVTETDSEGNDVVLRLPTAQEARAQSEAATRSLCAEMGWNAEKHLAEKAALGTDWDAMVRPISLEDVIRRARETA